MPDVLDAPRAPPDRRADVAIAAALIVAALAALSPVLQNGFVDFDDGEYIFQNQVVEQGFTWEGVRWAFGLAGDAPSYWQPLTLLSLMADAALFGVSARATHAINLAFHAGTALLLYAFLIRATGARGRSAVVALLFAVHPLQVESIAWAVERKSVLSAFLAMAALLAYAGHARAPSRPKMLGVVALTAGSLMAKVALAPLPFLMLLLDVWPLGRTRWAPPARSDWPARVEAPARLVAEKVPLFLVTCAVSFAALRTGQAFPETTPFALRVETAIVGYGQYLARAFWPARLGVFYQQPASIPPSVLVASVALLVAVTGAGILLARRTAAPLVGWLWFCGMLVPASGLVRNGLWPATADRFVYVPIVGLLVAVVWGLADRLPRSGRWPVAGGVLVALVAGALTVRAREQAGYWKDTETLFTHTATVEDGNILALLSRVATLEKAGKTDEALAAFDEALRQHPGNTVALINLGKSLERAGRVDEALATYDMVLRYDPGHPMALVNRGIIFQERGDLGVAEAMYRRAIQRTPVAPRALYDLALLVKKREGIVAALPLLEQAVRSRLRLADGDNQLASAYLVAGRLREAEASFRDALRRDRRHWHAAVNLARLLAAQGRGAEAAELVAEGRRRVDAAGEDVALFDRATAGLPGGGR